MIIAQQVVVPYHFNIINLLMESIMKNFFVLLILTFSLNSLASGHEKDMGQCRSDKVLNESGDKVSVRPLTSDGCYMYFEFTEKKGRGTRIVYLNEPTEGRCGYVDMRNNYYYCKI